MARLVCFDVGGVLIRITQLWHEAARHAGVEIRASLSPEAHLVDAPLFEDFQRGTTSETDYLDSTADYLGIGGEQALRVHNHIMLEQFDGVFEIVEELNRRGYQTTCLSNTNHLHWDDMHHSGRFPVIGALQGTYASHELKLDKPDPRIFKAFENLAGARADEIVFFDDSLPNVESATRLGWQSFVVSHSAEPAVQIRDTLSGLGILR